MSNLKTGTRDQNEPIFPKMGIGLNGIGYKLFVFI